MEKEVSELDRKLLLKKIYLDRVNYYTSRSNIDPQEFYSFVRKFFSELLKLDYEFTYEELSLELNKVFIQSNTKEKIDNFLLRLSESEYLEEEPLTREEIQDYLKEFTGIINSIIYEDKTVQEPDTLVNKFLKITHKGSLPYDKLQLSGMIDETTFYINSGNLDAAKKSYVTTIDFFDSLGKDEKKSYKDSLTHLYSELQELIKNPNRQPQTVASGADSATSLSKTQIDKVTVLIDETSFHISEGNVDAAKKSYVETLKVYDSLSIDSKTTLRKKVNDIYLELQELIKHPEMLKKKNIPAAETKTIRPSAEIKPSKISDEEQPIGKLAEVFVPETQKGPAIIAEPAKELFSIFTSEKTEDTSTLGTFNAADQYENESAASSGDSDNNVLLDLSSDTSLEDKSSADMSSMKEESYSKPKNAPIQETESTPSIRHVIIPDIAPEQTNELSDYKAPDQQINRFTDLLDRITELVRNKNTDAALDMYKEALNIYHSLDNSVKTLYYKKLYNSYSNIDELIHQKSLHELLDKHLTEAPSQRRVAPKSDKLISSNIVSTENRAAITDIAAEKGMVIENYDNPEISRIYELAEESYFNVSKNNTDLAKLKYYKALELYHKLPTSDKRLLYQNIYSLFKRLSMTKTIS